MANEQEQANPEQVNRESLGHRTEPMPVDRSKIDFDPDDGLYTGTAVDGTTEIPGPHEFDGQTPPKQAEMERRHAERQQAEQNQAAEPPA